VLAYLRSAAFLALALDALVGADARPQALLAPAPAAVMLAYARSATFLAIAFFTVMRASFVRHSGSCWRTLLAALASFELARTEPCRVVVLVDCLMLRAGTWRADLVFDFGVSNGQNFLFCRDLNPRTKSRPASYTEQSTQKEESNSSPAPRWIQADSGWLRGSCLSPLRSF
jgi:hypothetical protein